MGLRLKLGDPWEIEDPGITRKKYPCCARTHPAIEGILNVVNNHTIAYEDLAEIECATDDSAFEILIHPFPKSELEAKFSMPFCLAIAFLEKEVCIDHFSQKIIDKPIIKDIMKKIKHIPDSEIISKGYEYRSTTKILVKLKNGKEFYEIVDRPKGDPENPLTDEEIIEKFYRCTNGMIGERKKAEIIDKIKHLDEQQDILSLIGDLVFD